MKERYRAEKFDKTGFRYEKLVVLGPAESKNGILFWDCLCDCGRHVLIRTGCVGKIKACKACPILGAGRYNWAGFEGLSGAVISGIRASAKGRKREFAVGAEFLWKLFEIQNKRCALSGVEIYLPKTSNPLTSGVVTASLDRIDNKLGYIETNVQWLDKDVNYLKQKMIQENFIVWCHLVKTHQESLKNGITKYGPVFKEDLLIIPARKKNPKGKYSKTKGYKDLTGGVVAWLAQSGIKRDIKFKLDAKYLWDLFEKQEGKCALSGIPSVLLKEMRDVKLPKHTASLDRIDNNLPYIPGNVQWLHAVMNWMKHDYSQTEVIDWCTKISLHQASLNQTGN